MRILSSLNYIVGVLSLLALSAVAQSPEDQTDGEVVEIPLAEIWALRMPRTKDIRELEPHLEPTQWSALPYEQRARARQDGLLEPIIDSLIESSPHGPRKGHDALPCFAVAGQDRAALRRAHAVLVEGEQPRDSFPTTSNVTLVFFSHATAARFVHLRQVTRKGNELRIEYRLVPYAETYLSLNLALIPVGKLPAGAYTVTMAQSKVEKDLTNIGIKPASEEFIRQTIGRPFDFQVLDSTE